MLDDLNFEPTSYSDLDIDDILTAAGNLTGLGYDDMKQRYEKLREEYGDEKAPVQFFANIYDLVKEG